MCLNLIEGRVRFFFRNWNWCCMMFVIVNFYKGLELVSLNMYNEWMFRFVLF